jgi:hypothetical protein
MRRLAPLFSRLVVLLVIGSLVSSCALTNRLFRNEAAEAAAEALLRLQLEVMRFADEYTGRVADQVVKFQRSTDSASERLVAQTWLVTQATAAFTIASGPNPELNAIDMLVFVVLSRMVIDDHWINELYGSRADGLRGVHQALEKRAWDLATNLLTPAQSSELRSSIDAWHQQNPNQRAVAYIHLEDFAFATRAMRTATTSNGSVFSFLGLDPLSNLDPAVRQLAQARQLAERALFYGQRTPQLVVMETQRLVFDLAVMPESQHLLTSVGRLSAAAQQTSTLAADLPELLAKERAATIEQLTGVLDSRQGQLQGLIVELRSTLEAGTATSDSLKGTIGSLDALLARFERPAESSSQPRQPFDITQYTETARQLGATAQQLQELLNQVDANVPALGQLSEGVSDRAESLVDHMFWRLVQLALVLVAASLVAALGYRAIVRRWNRSPPS